MHYRPFGNNGFEVSEIGFGSNSVSGQGTYGYVDEADGIAAVHRAYELGVTFFDTAEGYSEGRSEEVLGKVLGNRPDVVICTKVGGRTGPITAPERLRTAAEGSLRRLRRDAIDVYLFHNPPTSQIKDLSLQEELERLKQEGKVRTYGVSTPTGKDVEQGLAVLELGGFTAIEVALNMVQHPVDTILPQLQQAGIGVITRVPLASGLLTGKYHRGAAFSKDDARGGLAVPPEQLERELSKVPALEKLAEAEGLSLVHAALAWVLSHEAVASAIPGAKRPSQVESTVAASGLKLSPVFLAQAQNIAQSVSGGMPA